MFSDCRSPARWAGRASGQYAQTFRDNAIEMPEQRRQKNTYSSDQLKPCAHGSLCVVLVRLRGAEVHQNAATNPPKRRTVSATHF
jgi:hypothetical protein